MKQGRNILKESIVKYRNRQRDDRKRWATGREKDRDIIKKVEKENAEKEEQERDRREEIKLKTSFPFVLWPLFSGE